jgi:hypothetical protein
MTSLLIDTMPENPLRSPDWRWQRAGYMTTHPESFRFNDDELVTRARTIYAAIELCTDMAELHALSQDFPLEFRVWELYKDVRYAQQRGYSAIQLATAMHRVLDVSRIGFWSYWT